MNHENMTTHDYLNYLRHDVHSTIFATVDENGHPATRVVDIMLIKGEKLYFLTANIKEMYRQLEKNPYVAITGVKGEDTMSSVSITIKGQVREIGTTYLDEIFEKNTYMRAIYETEESKKVLRVFEVYTGSLTVYDLNTKPIFQKTVPFGVS